MPLDNLDAFECAVAPVEFYVEALDDNVWLRSLTLGEMLELDFRQENKADLTMPLIQKCVVKEDGSPVFDDSERSRVVLSRLPGMAAQQIAVEIGRISGLSVEAEVEDAEKK